MSTIHNDHINLIGTIKGFKYIPTLGSSLLTVPIETIKDNLPAASFLIKVDQQNSIALSWWVSAKRTRSYPFARVYDTLGFSGKRVTIIPIYKDEGIDGDRDFIQWDTIALMSLLNVNVIISYYVSAVIKPGYKNKITTQRFDLSQINNNLSELINYKSDALHWNMNQIDDLKNTCALAKNGYQNISELTKVKMHSFENVEKRIDYIYSTADNFRKKSREHAQGGQNREVVTEQPKEKLEIGLKGKITITNYLGGEYYFTTDEVRIHEKEIELIECKHTSRNNLPSMNDVKDGLIKMALYTNIETINHNYRFYKPQPVLRLTSNSRISLSERDWVVINSIEKEAKINNFSVRYE